MLGTYATRYGLIAVVISILFVMLYTTLEMMEPHSPTTFSQFLASAGLEYWLVLTHARRPSPRWLTGRGGSAIG